MTSFTIDKFYLLAWKGNLVKFYFTDEQISFIDEQIKLVRGNVPGIPGPGVPR